MYLQNKYTTWYNNIIAKARLRVNQNGYTEKHHIIPKSLGGSDLKDNLVDLTPKEHYICHLLLTKMVEPSLKRKMWYASYMMMRGQKRYKPSARMYDLLRRNLIEANKERPGPNTGKKMSDEQKRKIGLAQKGRPKKPKTEEQKEKLRIPKTEEHKRKLSEARLGKTWGFIHSDDTKQKMSEWQKGIAKPKVVCEHCNKEISLMNYKRWHGDHCKIKSY